ncbi:MAG: glucan biosynthesis protein G [Opitutaceae bacterium]|nr:glucan biosynthesis protein G [Opitutaceae bacterium]
MKRAIIGAGLLLIGACAGAADFASLRSRARELAARPHAPVAGAVPQWLRELSYDDARKIQFDGGKSLWHGERLPFEIQFFHPGFIHDRTVRVAEIIRGRAETVPFRRESFNYHGLKLGELPPALGYAGFRVMHGLGEPDGGLREAGSFLGASYFRFLPRGAAYGLSARGLALNTAEPEPEEFPAFTEFWLERPAPGAASVGVLALLESESVAGAYRFTITPGAMTSMHVQAAIFRRKDAKVFGVAPLTSMFWRGENSNGPLEDYRPEVHDSDGLLMHNGRGEWLWRPLDNPRHVRVVAFQDEHPRGFGLLQRDREFEHYQDLEAAYHARPGAWIEPVGKWGRGSVRLVELPTKDEFNDNIVAFWSPETLPPPGEAVELEYRLRWFVSQIGPPAGFVRATRHGKTAYYEPGLHRFVVDFDGDALRAFGADSALAPELGVGDGAKLNNATLQKNAVNGTWRVAFTLRPDGTGRPVELRCFLKRGAQVLTETWSYLWQP